MRTMIVAFATLLGSLLSAQDIAGVWQGTLKTGPQDLRVIVQISKGEKDGWKATAYSIDEGPDAIPVSSITLDGSTIKMIVAVLNGTYEGKVSADGASITGTWTLGQPLPLNFERVNEKSAWPHDSSPHSVQFINVDKDVKLQVLDWGGSGRPVVLLTGQGNNAHVYDKLAPKLTSAYHVYGITRRGYGASTHPDPTAVNYAADRLGDDVLVVIDALKLKRPVLVGHSLGGEELSSVGSRHPEKVAGLIYLDAAYSYAYYDRSRGDLIIDINELRKKLEQLEPGKMPTDPKPLIHELLETNLPTLEKDLRELQKSFETPPPSMASSQPRPPMPPVARAVLAGMQRYTEIKVPILAIYALPHDPGPEIGKDAKTRAEFEARDEASTGAQAKAFETGLPSARVVRLPHANHYVFRSNEADVLREMNAFIGSLR
jgi:non-heme chloroperoxidase